MPCTQVIASLPASKHRLQVYRDAQAKDPISSQIMKYCRDGWPRRSQTVPDIHLSQQAQSKLTVAKEFLLYGSHIVVSITLQSETLRKIRHGHQGVQRCRFRASNSVWWPGISTQIKTMVEQCPECAKYSKPHHEPMISSILPDYP